MNGFFASLQFITAIPLGKPQPFEPKAIIVHFPLVGLAIGMILALFDLAASTLWPPLVVSALDILLLTIVTGAFHLDGLADMADGLYGQGDQERRLAIMKDSRVGAMGLVAVSCLLLTKTLALGAVDHLRFLSRLVVPSYARSAMLFGMRFLPYARGESGTGSAFFETPLNLADFRFVALPLFFSLFLGWRGIVLNLTFALTIVTLIHIYRKKMGGITGDMLGAMVEIAETALFLAICLGGGQ